MRLLKITAATLAIAGFSGQAMAQDSGVYVNLGVDAVEFDSYNVNAKLGYNLNDYFGAEGQVAFGISDDTVDGVDVGVDTSFAGFGVVRYPLTEKAEIFARAGYHSTDVSVGADGVSVDVDTDGFAIGAGGQFFFTENDGVRLEYTYYDLNVDDDLSSESDSADVFTLSYVRKF